MASRRSVARDAAIALGVAVLYVAAAKLGLALAFRAAQVSAVWPPTGFALAVVVLLGRRAVPGILLGAFVANATAGEPAWVAAGIAAGNTLEAIAGAAILRRLGFDAALARVRDVLALFAAVAAAPVVSATLGVAFLVGGGLHPPAAVPALWLVWWLGDALGGLIVAPLILVWSRGGRRRRGTRGLLEPAAMLAGIAVAAGCVFLLPARFPAAYLVYPFLIWGGLRLGPAYTTTGSLLANAIAVAGTLAGRGPYAGAGPEGGLVLVQTFMAVGAATALILGAVAAESRRAHEQLRLADRRKDEFLAMLGHELRNPLAAIVHAVDLLASDVPDERGDAQRVIRRQSRGLSRLVDDLLDVSRITRGQIALDRRPLALAEVVSAGADVWRHLLAQKRQRLTIDVPAALGVEGDPARLGQVLANLVHNAAKFTPEEGAIRITAAAEGGAAVLRVHDEGRGMTPDVLAHAFELFVQGPAPLDRQQGGLGLGLTLVHRLVEMHGGTVEAHSEGADRGTEIIVRLPRTAAPPAVVPPPAHAPAPVRSRRVLVVDDNADVRAMLVYLLEHNGHQVRAAGDGPAAIAEALAFSPQIVLLDVGLPGMDGYGVVRELRSSPRTADALIVALTGYGQPSDRERALAAGFDDHLLKPTEPAQVLAMVQRER
jgi:signal transduction histidine kinase